MTTGAGSPTMNVYYFNRHLCVALRPLPVLVWPSGGFSAARVS
jgi:hypothetical protein